MIQLRPYQSEAIDATLRYLAENDGNPLIVLPTGTGKSIVIAEFCRQILSKWADSKIIVVTHVRELIKQNYDELKSLWPEAPAGINSAGLKKRDYKPSIVFCGIQSVYKKATDFTKVDLVLVDEAHLIPRKTSTMYQKFLKNLKIMNPHVRVIGLTATPYRLDSGLLHSGEGSLFDGIAYEADLKDMVSQGYLTKLVSKQPKTKLDVTNVRLRGGEFIPGELERAVNKLDINAAVVREIVAYGADRKSWLIFCSGVDHAINVAQIVRQYGITCETIFGDTPDSERDRIVADFKAGRIRALASMGVLTTGFNAPSVDLLALLRPTQSTGLYCLDQETEVLTSHGWKGIGQVKEGDCVPTLDLQTGKGKWSSVLAYMERDTLEGEHLVEYEAPRANFRVTDNHRMIFKTKNEDSWRINEAWEMALYHDTIKMPTAVEIDQVGVPLTDAELYFIGMMMTDGTWSSHQATIYQSERHPEIIERIEKYLTECNLAWVKSRIKARTSFEERYPRWRYSISAGKPRLGKEGSGFRHLMPFLDKDFSPALMSISKRQFIVLFQAIHDGDGFKVEKSPGVDWTPRSLTICSARKNAVDRLQALAAIHGFTGHLRAEHKNRKNPIYILTISPKDWRSIGGVGDRPKVKRTSPTITEKVWCVETQTGTLITRRKGKVTVMGNCQIMGRGMRNHPDKSDCLVLDFAGNVARHGPVDRVNPKKPRKADGEGVAPTKTCPQCKSIVFAGVSECIDCGYIWPPKQPEIDKTASTLPVMSMAAPAEWVKVNSVAYRIHKKPGKPDSMRVEYRCGLQVYPEWVCFEHKGYPKDKAIKWWRARMTGPGSLPTNTIEAIAKATALMKPSEIKVQKNGKYTEITKFRFMPNVPPGGERISLHSPNEKQSPQGSLLLHEVHG